MAALQAAAKASSTGGGEGQAAAAAAAAAQDLTAEARLLLGATRETGNRFGMLLPIKLLRGSKDKRLSFPAMSKTEVPLPPLDDPQPHVRQEIRPGYTRRPSARIL